MQCSCAPSSPTPDRLGRHLRAAAMPGVVARVHRRTTSPTSGRLPPRLPMMNKAMVRPMMASRRGAVRRRAGRRRGGQDARRSRRRRRQSVSSSTTERCPRSSISKSRWPTRSSSTKRRGPTCRSSGACRRSDGDPFAACDVVDRIRRFGTRDCTQPDRASRRRRSVGGGRSLHGVGVLATSGGGEVRDRMRARSRAGHRARHRPRCGRRLRGQGRLRLLSGRRRAGVGGAAARAGRCVGARRAAKRWSPWATVAPRPTTFASVASRDGRSRTPTRSKRLQDSGAYPAMGTFVTSNLRNSGTGVYAIPPASVRGSSVVTNTTPTVAFRGAGRPEAACDIERAIDRFALTVGLDPVEVRLRNVVAADVFPYKTAIGSTYDSGRYDEAIHRCVEVGRLRRVAHRTGGAAAARNHVATRRRRQLHGRDHRRRRRRDRVGHRRSGRLGDRRRRHVAARAGSRDDVRRRS